MRRLLRRASVSGLALLVSACTTADLKELRHVTPKGDAFAVALSGHYLAFSEQEAINYDWSDSQHFADKGLRAAYGQKVTPEEIRDWRIPRRYRPELADARNTLMELLTPEIRRQYPKLLADAVFAYDCWMEEQEENWQIESIETCRDRFYSALGTIQEKLSSAVIPVDAAPAPLLKAGGEVKTKENTDFKKSSYVLFFDLAKAKLRREAEAVINQVVKTLKGIDNYEVVIHGHADRSGSASYNLQLSQKRAERVRNVLVRRGVADELITLFAFGESDPQVMTVDGVREPKNRRVEIFLSN